MTEEITDVAGVRVLMCAPGGPALADDGAVLDLIGAALGGGARWVCVPADRIPDDFFRLRTGLAGSVAQKFVNYRLGLAVLGDIRHRTSASPTLRDFVGEANRGRQLWFLEDRDEFAIRLAAAGNAP